MWKLIKGGLREEIPMKYGVMTLPIRSGEAQVGIRIGVQ